MTSTRPYLIRAFYDWIINNACTPHIVVNASFQQVEVPQEYVEGGQIVLNISMAAVQGLLLGDTAIEFQARFGGRVRQIHAPVASVLAIYAKENGRGMVFAEEEDGEDPLVPPPAMMADTQSKHNTSQSKGKKRPGGRAHLTVVK